MSTAMSKVLAFALAFAVALPASHALPQVAGAPIDCTVPTDLIEDEPTLPATAALIKAQKPLIIAAIGGSSTLGTGAGGDSDAAYPHQLQLALAKRFPGLPITVLNKGAPRQVAQQMFNRFDRDVADSHATLVVWEVGVTDAVRQTDPDEFAQTLQAGIAWLHEHDMEVMLIDMQYSPDTTAVINFEPYLNTLHEVGSLTETYVFRRYDVMKYWSDNGVFQFTDVPIGERRALAARVYACLGARLADAIAYAAR
jgi:acyl-CoA thioesterase I